MNDDPNAGPLSDDEIADLDRFLVYECASDEPMDISTLDGFLTAIVCGPTTIMPSEWMPWVWDAQAGEQGPGFESDAEARHILALLMRHYNDIALTLYRTPDAYEPLLSESPNDGDPVPILDDWCYGFMKGVERNAEGWRPMMEAHADWMSTIHLYGTEAGWEALDRDDISIERHRALAAELPESIRKIHRFWLDRRESQISEGITPFLVRREPVRNPDKVGRNDPCPCGSGKKFKRCHGAAERLH